MICTADQSDFTAYLGSVCFSRSAPTRLEPILLAIHSYLLSLPDNSVPLFSRTSSCLFKSDEQLKGRPI